MTKAYKLLRENRNKLTRQQILTIRGQIKSGDTEGAIKGIARLTGKEVTAYPRSK